MNDQRRTVSKKDLRLPRKPVFLLSIFLSLCLPGLAFDEVGLARVQSVDLQPGWNAVYLEVDPVLSDPDELFAGEPVDVVASFTPSTKAAQFVLNPSAGMLNAYGWAVWYGPSRPDSFLTTLYRVYGAKAYLIHAATNTTLDISGTVPPVQPTWTPDAYNFVGFSVDGLLAPTFQQFFRGSSAHNHNQIYRLVEGTWRQVLDPAAENMRSGEAFWINCRGPSDYPGPLEVSTRSLGGLNLSSSSDSAVVFRNRANHPVSFTVEHIVDPDQPIPLSSPVRIVDEDAGGHTRTISVHFDADHFEQTFPALEAGRAIEFPLALRLQDAGPGVRHSLLKVVTDIGTVSYVPVTATRGDL